MKRAKDDANARRGAEPPARRDAAKGAGPEGESSMEVCDSARVAETYRLESPDEACDDGIR
jgi:hypothetical protein